MANDYRSIEDMYPIVGSGDLGQLSDADMEMVTPDMIRAQLAGAMGNTSDLERQILERQIADRNVTGIGPVPEMSVGYFQDPKNVVQLGTVPVGGLAAGMGAGAKGIAQYTGVRSAIEGLKPLGESIFAFGADPSVMARIAAVALGIGGAATTLAGDDLKTMEESQLSSVANSAGLEAKEARSELRRRYDERAAANLRVTNDATLAPSNWRADSVTTDAGTLSVQGFIRKYGVLPEKAFTLIEERNRRHPPGFFRRVIGD